MGRYIEHWGKCTTTNLLGNWNTTLGRLGILDQRKEDEDSNSPNPFNKYRYISITYF